MAVSDNLKKARKSAGLSQAEMAEKLGLNLRTYGSYERGERDLSTSLLLNICKTLEISSDILLDTGSLSAYKMPSHSSPKTDGVSEYKMSPAKPADALSATDKEIQTKLADLNDTGKVKALDYISDLWEQEKYTKKV